MFDDISPTDYDALTREIIRRELKPDSTCVDVGCHSGEILDMMLEAAPQGEFFGFEPIPSLAEGLREKYQNDRIHIFELALSDEKGQSTFNHVLSNPGYSGLKRRKYDRPNEIDEQITVAMETLDNVIGQKQVDFMKIDVEGAELQVMRGGKRVLANSRPLIVFEHGLGSSECYGTTPSLVWDLLVSELRFRIFCLHEYLVQGNSLERAEFERLYQSGAHYYFLAV